MITVQVRYFALLREQRGLAEEALTTSATTAAQLYAELARRHMFTLPVANLRAAINGEFVAWPGGLKEGDTVVFIPPVAGG